MSLPRAGHPGNTKHPTAALSLRLPYPRPRLLRRGFRHKASEPRLKAWGGLRTRLAVKHNYTIKKDMPILETSFLTAQYIYDTELLITIATCRRLPGIRLGLIIRQLVVNRAIPGSWCYPTAPAAPWRAGPGPAARPHSFPPSSSKMYCLVKNSGQKGLSEDFPNSYSHIGI